MDSSERKRSSRPDKEKRRKKDKKISGKKHKPSKRSDREKKVKAETFSVGVYNALPVDSMLLTKSSSGKVAPDGSETRAKDDDGKDCACGVGQHPKLVEEAAEKHKHYPVPDALSLTSGSLGNLNRDVYGSTASSPRPDSARSSPSSGQLTPSLSSPSVYRAGVGSLPTSAHSTNTSNRSNKSNAPERTQSPRATPAAVYGSFENPMSKTSPSAAATSSSSALGVSTAPGAVERPQASTPLSTPDSVDTVRAGSSAALLPVGTGLFRSGSLKATPVAADRYNAFFKSVQSEPVPVTDTQFTTVQETDTYITQAADDGSESSESESEKSDDEEEEEAADVKQAPRYVFWDDETGQRRVEGLLWKLEQRLRSLEEGNPTPGKGADRPPYSAITADEYVYNKRFQEIMELNTMDKFDHLSSLGSDFVKLAETYARIIISEKCLPVEQKSIKPVNIGGAAGGDKFLVNGILYKYAVDTQIGTFEDGSPRYIYGGAEKDDAAAIKAANNELLGLSQALKCNIPGLSFPLMAIIDYVGYRLVAVSTLPINRKTIVYGSADAGRSVHNDDPFVNDAMQHLGRQLNLREHLVFDQNIVGAGDVEVHKGFDGRYYMVDFARLLPPEALQQGENPQNIFHRLLRPELVRQYSKPLSSDSFSGWQSTDPQAQEYNADVVGATQYLYDLIENEYPKRYMSPGFQLYFQREICNICDLHRSGINLRHLGLVRQSMLKHTLKNSVIYISEMVSRVLKNRLFHRYRHLMDRLKIFAEEPFKEEFVNMLNTIACPTRYPDFWKREVKELIIAKFGESALTEKEKQPEYDLLKSSSQLFLLFRMQYLLGCMLPTSVDEDARAAFDEGREFEFTVYDVMEESAFRPRIKYMPIIDFASGVSMYLQALRGSENIQRAASNTRLLLDARKKLLSAYNRLTDFAACRFFLAKVYTLIQLNRHSPKDADDLGRSVALLRYVRRDEPGNLDAALDLTVSAALLVILATDKEKESVKEYIAVAKENYVTLSRYNEELHDAVVPELSAWMNNLQKLRAKAVPSETMKSYRAKAQDVMKQILSPMHFSAFAAEVTVN